MGGLSDFLTRHRELVSYAFWGVVTTLVSWGTYALFVTCGINATISNVLSWVCGVAVAFVTNKFYVFHSESHEKHLVAREFGTFVSSRIASGVVSWVAFPILVAVGLNQSIFGIESMWARVVTSVVEIVMNWFFSKYLVFRRGQRETLEAEAAGEAAEKENKDRRGRAPSAGFRAR